MIDITYRKIATSVDGDAAVAVDAATSFVAVVVVHRFLFGSVARLC